MLWGNLEAAEKPVSIAVAVDVPEYALYGLARPSPGTCLASAVFARLAREEHPVSLVTDLREYVLGLRRPVRDEAKPALHRSPLDSGTGMD